MNWMLKAPGCVNLVLQVTSLQTDLNFLLLAEILSIYSILCKQSGHCQHLLLLFFYVSKIELSTFNGLLFTFIAYFQVR